MFESYFSFIARYNKNSSKKEEESTPQNMLQMYNTNNEPVNLLIFNESETNEEEITLTKKKTEEGFCQKKTSVKKINEINKFLKASEFEESKNLRKCNDHLIQSIDHSMKPSEMDLSDYLLIMLNQNYRQTNSE